MKRGRRYTINRSLSSTIDNAMDVLRVLARNPFQYKISELEKELDLSRTSITRILGTLEKNNLVIRSPETKKYVIGPFAYHLGSIYLHNANYKNRVVEILNELSNRLKVSSGLARKDGERVIAIFSVENYKPLSINYEPGTFFPMNRGCYGKCLMAYHDRNRVQQLLKKQTFKKICENTLTDFDLIIAEYDQIRQQGYVISDGEVFPLAVGVGIPVFSNDGEVRHCAAVSFLKNKNYQRKIEECKEALFEYSDELNNLIP
jgi:DNA-binding IclR family transcriptional regulator